MLNPDFKEFIRLLNDLGKLGKAGKAALRMQVLAGLK